MRIFESKGTPNIVRNIINRISTDINKIIAYKEMGLSQYALMNGWNINSILSKYKNIDYRKINKDINPTSNNGDPYYTDGYFGKTINKYDVIFLKNNRKIKYN